MTRRLIDEEAPELVATGEEVRHECLQLASERNEEQEIAGEREDSILNAILEQLVCAKVRTEEEGEEGEGEGDGEEEETNVMGKGVVFIGTRRSTFTETIVEERVRNGFSTGSNYLVP